MEYVILCGALLTGSLVFWAFTRTARIKRYLRKQTRFDVAYFPIGEKGRLEGQVRSAEESPLRAPFSGRPCVAWRVVVREHRTSPYRGPVFETSQNQNFLVDDGTGQALVSSTAVTSALREDKPYYAKKLPEGAPSPEEFLDQYGFSHEEVDKFNSLRFHESILEVGDPVVVSGYRARDDRNGHMVLTGDIAEPLHLTNVS